MSCETGDCQTGYAIENAKLENIRSNEYRDRQKEQRRKTNAFSLRVQFRGGKRCITIHSQVMLRRVANRGVKQIAFQSFDSSVRFEGLVNIITAPPAAGAIVQAQFVIRIPTRVFYPSAKIKCASLHLEAGGRRLGVFQRRDHST